MPTPTAQLLSQTRYLTDGLTTVWDFSFADGYLDPAYVKAYTEDASYIRTPIVVTAPMLVSTFQLQVTPALAAGLTLVVYRDTPKDAPLVNFIDESGFSEIALDTNARQSIMVAAEAIDQVNVSAIEQAIQAAALAEIYADAANASELAASASASAAAGSAASALASANTATSAAGTVVANISAINTVSANIANVNTVGTDISSVNSVASSVGSVITVAGQIAAVVVTAANMASVIAAPSSAVAAAVSASAANGSAISADASAIAAAASAVSADSDAIAAAASAVLAQSYSSLGLGAGGSFDLGLITSPALTFPTDLGSVP